jgi:hypothetical protein
MSTAEQALRRVAEMVAELVMHSTLSDPDQLFGTLISVVARGVAGAESVSVVTRDGARFSTVAATDELARRVDGHQFELGAGPCVEAIAEMRACHVPDLSGDRCWPEFTRWADQECGLASVLSVGFAEPGAREGGASLNLYSARAGSVDSESLQVVLLLAAYAGALFAAANKARRVINLEQAMHTNSDIGTAIGVIMVRYRRSHDEARDLLRVTSQHANRKVSDLASQVIDTGELPRPTGKPPGPAAQRRRPAGR